MKTVFFRTILAAFLGLLFLNLVGCKKKESCQSANGACGSFRACCTTSQCYYTYGGKRFDCDGTNCSAAAQRLANYMCGTSYRQSNEPLSTTEQEALRQTKILIETNTPCATCP